MLLRIFQLPKNSAEWIRKDICYPKKKEKDTRAGFHVLFKDWKNRIKMYWTFYETGKSDVEFTADTSGILEASFLFFIYPSLDFVESKRLFVPFEIHSHIRKLRHRWHIVKLSLLLI